MTTLIVLVSCYVMVAAIWGCGLRWLDQTECAFCGEDPPNLGWWPVLLHATGWPVSLSLFVHDVVRGAVK